MKEKDSPSFWLGHMTRSQKTIVRVVSGSLRGRKIPCVVTPELRPTPQMVREALFSILGNAIPDRPFFDIFAGTGVVGLEAISRGAKTTTFMERDAKLAGAIESCLRDFQVSDRGIVMRADVYRWAERWLPPANQPVNLFVSPPFPDLQKRLEQFVALVSAIQTKMPNESVLVLQLETGFNEAELPLADEWERRQYGRNLLFIWQRLPAESNRSDEEE